MDISAKKNNRFAFLFTHYHVVPNLCNFLLSLTKKIEDMKKLDFEELD